MHHHNLTSFTTQGYLASDEDSCPHRHSSPAAMAWHAGRWLRANARPRPRTALMSQVYCVKVDELVLDVQDPDGIRAVQ